MRYNVHIFPVLHVKFVGIEAENQTAAAMEEAERLLDCFRYLLEAQKPLPCIEYYELADGEPPSHFLVDEQDDEEYEQSRWYNGDQTLMQEMYVQPNNHQQEAST